MSQSVSGEQGTKEKILSAGKKVIFERGFSRARVSDITARAGVAHGTFYLYFSSKEEILLELLKMVRDEMASVIDRGLKSLREGRKEEGMSLIFLEPFRLMLRERELAKIFFFEAICSSGEFQKFYMEGKEIFYNKTLEALGALGTPRAEIRSHILLGTARHLIELNLLTGREVESLWKDTLRELGLFQ